MYLSTRRVPNHRAWLSAACGVLAVLVVPVAVYLTHRLPAPILDAAWAIPVGFALALSSLLFARGARAAIAVRLGRVGGAGWIRAGRILAIAGFCIVLSASISVGVYELLLRLES